jgi:hypothetical protein
MLDSIAGVEPPNSLHCLLILIMGAYVLRLMLFAPIFWPQELDSIHPVKIIEFHCGQGPGMTCSITVQAPARASILFSVTERHNFTG